MKKIVTALLHYFRNEAHYEFMVVFSDLIHSFPPAMMVVLKLMQAFLDLFMLEDRLVNLMHKSDYTKKIAEEDHRVDRAITGMRSLIAAALHHFDPAVVDAAQSLYNRFAAFGNMAQKTYEEETADVHLLIRDLQSADYADKVTVVGLAPWLTELRAAETAFETLLAQRNTETAEKPQERLKDVRREIDKVYHQMTDRINAAATMDNADTYTQFINELNAKITYFNDHRHHHALKDISVSDHCVIEPIDTQKYTEKAIIPIPKAHWREKDKPTVELVFAKDFSVTYKNNVEVGTADVILHGKGAYKGQKTATFNIAR
jgi:hypothetical protein